MIIKNTNTSLIGYHYPLILIVKGHSDPSVWNTRVTVHFDLDTPETDFGTLYLGGNGPCIYNAKPDKYPVGHKIWWDGIITGENDDLATIEAPGLGYGSGVNWHLNKDILDVSLLRLPVPVIKRFKNWLHKLLT